MATAPLTAARYPTGDDAPNGPAQIQAAVMDLDGYTIPRFPNATARDNAYANEASAGYPLREGMHCYMLDDHRLWRYDGAVWTWPKAAQGQLARADYATASGTSSLANTATGLPAFNLTVPYLPAHRNVELVFTGMLQGNTVNTSYGFLLNLGSLQTRGIIGVPGSNTGNRFYIAATFDSGGSAQANVTGGVVGGSFSGTAPAFAFTSTAPDGPVSYQINDLGAV